MRSAHTSEIAATSKRGWPGAYEKRVAGQRGRDDREGVGGIAAEAAGIGQARDQLVELPDRAGPAVREQQRVRIRADAGLVDEVQVDARERDLELLERVELRLLGAPVEAVAPVLDERAQIVQVRAVGPLGAGNLVRPAGAREPAAQVVQNLVGDVESERLGHRLDHASLPPGTGSHGRASEDVSGV